MIDSSNAAWNKEQLTDHIAHIIYLIKSPVFKQSAPFSRQSQTRWIELIRAVGELVMQALQAGKRIDFTEDVSAHGERQDITSLLQSMRQSAHVFRTDLRTHPELAILSPTLNHVYGVGMGHFSNGVRFHCEHADELAFFVGNDRIYFHRHLIRAFMEARYYLKSLP